jgi:hypothetical protein
MTDPVETTEDTTVVDSPDTTPDTDAGGATEASEGAQEPGETGRLRREAAGYRTKLRTSETTVADLQARIAQLQLAEVHRLAGDLAQPSDALAVSGKSLADLLDTEGNLDAELVSDIVAEVLSSRPGLAKHPKSPAVDPTQGSGGSIGHKVGWGDLLK